MQTDFSLPFLEEVINRLADHLEYAKIEIFKNLKIFLTSEEEEFCSTFCKENEQPFVEESSINFGEGKKNELQNFFDENIGLILQFWQQEFILRFKSSIQLQKENIVYQEKSDEDVYLKEYTQLYNNVYNAIYGNKLDHTKSFSFKKEKLPTLQSIEANTSNKSSISINNNETHEIIDPIILQQELELKNKEIVMLKEMVTHRDILLNEQRSEYYKELLILREEILKLNFQHVPPSLYGIKFEQDLKFPFLENEKVKLINQKLIDTRKILNEKNLEIRNLIYNLTNFQLEIFEKLKAVHNYSMLNSSSIPIDYEKFLIEIDLIREKVDRMSSDNLVSLKKYDSLKNDFFAVVAENDNLLKENKRLNRLFKLRKVLGQIQKESLLKKLEISQQKIKNENEFNKIVNDLNEQLLKKEQTLQALRIHLMKDYTKFSKYKRKISELESEQFTLEHEKERKSLQLSEFLRYSTAEMMKMEDLIGWCRRFRKEREDMENRIIEIEEHDEYLKKENITLQSKVESLQHERDSLKKETLDLNKGLQQLRNQIERMKKAAQHEQPTQVTVKTENTHQQQQLSNVTTNNNTSSTKSGSSKPGSAASSASSSTGRGRYRANSVTNRSKITSPQHRARKETKSIPKETNITVNNKKVIAGKDVTSSLLEASVVLLEQLKTDNFASTIQFEQQQPSTSVEKSVSISNINSPANYNRTDSQSSSYPIQQNRFITPKQPKEKLSGKESILGVGIGRENNSLMNNNLPNKSSLSITNNNNQENSLLSGNERINDISVRSSSTKSTDNLKELDSQSSKISTHPFSDDDSKYNEDFVKTSKESLQNIESNSLINYQNSIQSLNEEVYNNKRPNIEIINDFNNEYSNDDIKINESDEVYEENETTQQPVKKLNNKQKKLQKKVKKTNSSKSITQHKIERNQIDSRQHYDSYKNINDNASSEIREDKQVDRNRLNRNNSFSERASLNNFSVFVGDNHLIVKHGDTPNSNNNHLPNIAIRDNLPNTNSIQQDYNEGAFIYSGLNNHISLTKTKKEQLQQILEQQISLQLEKNLTNYNQMSEGDEMEIAKLKQIFSEMEKEDKELKEKALQDYYNQFLNNSFNSGTNGKRNDSRAYSLRFTSDSSASHLKYNTEKKKDSQLSVIDNLLIKSLQSTPLTLQNKEGNHYLTENNTTLNSNTIYTNNNNTILLESLDKLPPATPIIGDVTIPKEEKLIYSNNSIFGNDKFTFMTIKGKKLFENENIFKIQSLTRSPDNSINNIEKSFRKESQSPINMSDVNLGEQNMPRKPHWLDQKLSYSIFRSKSMLEKRKTSSPLHYSKDERSSTAIGKKLEY
ncbi:hypothetical protein ABK040_010875 [Willaertia magna]